MAFVVAPDYSDWYWGPSQSGQFYSSRRQALVVADDAGLSEWKGTPQRKWPTQWPRDEGGNQTKEALNEVLTSKGQPTLP